MHMLHGADDDIEDDFDDDDGDDYDNDKSKGVKVCQLFKKLSVKIDDDELSLMT